MKRKYCAPVCIVFALIAFNIFLAFPAAAKSICGEKSCYGCCTDNCEGTFLEKKDVGRKELKRAIKACKAGCSSLHWTGSSLSGRLSSKAQRKLSKYCAENEPGYSGYCLAAIRLWGKNCGSNPKPEPPDDKPGKSDVDEKWNRFEAAVREDMAVALIKHAFPSLTDVAIVALMNSNRITRGVNLRTLTTPLRMAQEVQRIINQISRVEGITPVRGLDTVAEISTALESEVRNRSRAGIPPSTPSKPSLVKYRGLSDEALISSVNQDLQFILARVSKPDVDPAELKAAIVRLIGIYDLLIEEIDDPGLKQMIQQVRATMQHLLSRM